MPDAKSRMKRRDFLPIVAIACGWPAVAARAQLVRVIPDNSPSAIVEFLSPDEIVVDGRHERVGPGVRVHDAQNRAMFMKQMVGNRVWVRYRRDPAGRIFELWVLTPSELEVAQRLRKQQRLTR